MALGRLISKAIKKTAKEATKKKGTLKPTKRGNMYTRDKDSGQVRSISKKTEERYDRMAEQKVKTAAKKEGKKAGAAVAGVGAAAAGAGVIAEKKQQNKKNEAAAKKRATERKKNPSSTKGYSQKQLSDMGKAIAKGAEANKRKKNVADTEKAAKAAKTMRAANKKVNAKAETKSYKIKSGDTLSAIARANGTTVATLMKLNPQIKDKDKIYAGRTMKLPKK